MNENATSPPDAARPCPVCGAPIDPASPAARRFRPFCSRACADVDLLRWLRGGYVIPGKGPEDDEDGEAGRTPDSSEDAPDGERGDRR